MIYSNQKGSFCRYRKCIAGNGEDLDQRYLNIKMHQAVKKWPPFIFSSLLSVPADDTKGSKDYTKPLLK